MGLRDTGTKGSKWTKENCWTKGSRWTRASWSTTRGRWTWESFCTTLSSWTWDSWWTKWIMRIGRVGALKEVDGLGRVG